MKRTDVPDRKRRRSAKVVRLPLPPARAEAPPSPTPKESASAPAVSAMDRAAESIARWRKEPWTFVREVFGVEPDPWQDQMLHALVESGLDKLAMKACKGPGKSCLLSWVIWWFLICFTHPKILCTSITAENLRDGLWSELAKWYGKSEILKGFFAFEAERIYAKGYKETWFCAARTWPKEADKTKQADTLAGQHAQHTMIVLDEAGGIPVGVLAAGLAHHSTQDPLVKEIHITMMAGNPTNLDSALGWACTEDSAHWWVKEITGDPDDPMRAPRIDVAWAREQILKFGADNDWVLVNVFGKFPKTQENKLLGPDAVRAAMDVCIPEGLWNRAPKIMSVDVARSLNRDRSVLCRRQGGTVFPFRVYRIDDLMVLAGQIAFEFARWPADVIFVDIIGFGAGVHDRLRDLRFPVVGIHCGLPSPDIRFADVRTEMWFNGSQEIKAGKIALPNERELVPELTGPMIEFTPKGKLKLESKEKMLARGIQSPDIGDALMQTWAQPIAWSTSLPASTMRAVRAGQCVTEFDPFEEV